VPEFSREIKGLDMVRRDWSDISKKCSDFALDTILSGKSKEEIISLIADYLAEVTNKIKVNYSFLF
jgi:DNA polymerase alpha subunit A